MKVDGPGGPRDVQRRAATTRKTATDGSFADLLGRDGGRVDQAEGPETTGALAAVSAVLAAQADDRDGQSAARQRAMRHAEDLLDRLDEIRHGLLVGAIPKDRLASLAQKVRERRETVRDPRLAAILDEIELRVSVEIAKLTRTDDAGRIP